MKTIPIIAAAMVLWLAPTAPALAQEGFDSLYTVKPGDLLEVSVWKEEDLKRQVLVRPDGRFSFPLAGDIDATGKTVEQLRTELIAVLEKYIPELVVTVTVTEIRGNKIYVIGQVNSPGEFIMNRRIDVMQALSVAGGTTAFAALNDIIILRRGSDGKQHSTPFSYKAVESGKSLDQNILLSSGDIVVVP
jgi:polysaccharide export outer membrane protein